MTTLESEQYPTKSWHQCENELLMYRYTVEPLLYDHPQNHIDVVV